MRRDQHPVFGIYAPLKRLSFPLYDALYTQNAETTHLMVTTAKYPPLSGPCHPQPIYYRPYRSRVTVRRPRPRPQTGSRFPGAHRLLALTVLVLVALAPSMFAARDLPAGDTSPPAPTDGRRGPDLHPSRELTADGTATLTHDRRLSQSYYDYYDPTVNPYEGCTCSDWRNFNDGLKAARDANIAGGVITGIFGALWLICLKMWRFNYAPYRDNVFKPAEAKSRELDAQLAAMKEKISDHPSLEEFKARGDEEIGIEVNAGTDARPRVPPRCLPGVRPEVPEVPD